MKKNNQIVIISRPSKDTGDKYAPVESQYEGTIEQFLNHIELTNDFSYIKGVLSILITTNVSNDQFILNSNETATKVTLIDGSETNTNVWADAGRSSNSEYIGDYWSYMDTFTY